MHFSMWCSRRIHRERKTALNTEQNRAAEKNETLCPYNSYRRIFYASEKRRIEKLLGRFGYAKYTARRRTQWCVSISWTPHSVRVIACCVARWSFISTNLTASLISFDDWQYWRWLRLLLAIIRHLLHIPFVRHSKHNLILISTWTNRCLKLSSLFILFIFVILQTSFGPKNAWICVYKWRKTQYAIH